MAAVGKGSGGTRYIFVTGGVISGLGKGITSASLGYLLKQAGYRVIIQKFDPYLNVDPGTMSPTQHGEVYVTDDGAETDLDLGHYERFLDISMSRMNNATAGQIYSSVLEAERRGKYLGKTVQVIPHVTNEIIRRFTQINKKEHYDIIITEVGGTVGDIESLPFLEAIRQFENRLDRHAYMNIHVTLLPYVHSSEEIKTKPTQHSVQKLREIGLSPDMIMCRSGSTGLDTAARNKISLFSNVRPEAVIDMPDAETIYEIPLIFKKQGVYLTLAKHLRLERRENPDMNDLRSMVRRIKDPKYNVVVGIVGKYTGMKDSYKSITESFIHAGAANNTRVRLVWVDAEDLENAGRKEFEKTLRSLDGILIPGGFGGRGIEGKILAARYAREHQVPYFGICLGMQIAVIEFARHIMGLEKANSTEFNPATPHPVIDKMEEQKKIRQLGATMRLGAFDCELQPGSLVSKAYNEEKISERHRHRYEVNNAYRDALEAKGLRVAGVNRAYDLVECIELPGHPWFVGVQFHPELKSRVAKAHPLFREFVAAILKSKGPQ
ncbi:MAG: CTP synthase [Candidatus Marinimicrobia bacterium]|jgi:CTP synthase|nr:CTP synthase [Candidatus Neomarinimicrobiota bacterium]MDD5709917.1 CTP synthase [Candidatus Neomarinimicrobiota bacterium]MDX9778334.1 CTP synthase [bacterium]